MEQLNLRLLSSFIAFWMTVSDDESALVVASVGADPYHSGSHGVCWIQLWVGKSELERGGAGSVARSD